MAGNVLVKINPDRSWIVVSSLETRNASIYYQIFRLQPLNGYSVKCISCSNLIIN